MTTQTKFAPPTARRALRYSLSTFALALGVVDPAAAQAIWSGGASSNYGEAANWSAGAVATGSIAALFNDTVGAGSTLVDLVGGSFNPAALTITGNTAFTISNGTLTTRLTNSASADQTIAAILSGGSTITHNGPGTLILTGDNSATGSTTINGGALQIGDGGASGSIGGSIANNGGALVFNRADALTYSKSIGGSGGEVRHIGAGALTLGGAISGANTSLRQSGSGVTIITANNSYAGGTFIDSGTLQLGNGSTLSNSLGSGDVVNNGTLAFNRGSVTSFANAISGSGLSTNIAAGGTLTVSGVISGSGSFSQAGGGTTVLTGNNTYTGGTAIDNGVLRVSSDANLGDAAGALSFSGVGTLSTTASFATARTITLDAGGGIFNPARDTTLTLTGVISGSGKLTQSGFNGKLVLTADNHYSGGTVVNGGVLQVGDGGVSGSLGTGDVVLSGYGSTLAFNRADDIFFASQITGDGVIMQMGPGTLHFANDQDYRSSTIISSGGLAIEGVTIAAGGQFVVGDYVNSGPGLLPGASRLTITQGGVLNTRYSGDYAYVGYQTDDLDTALIDGAGSEWYAARGLIIGSSRDGNGAIAVQNGGLLKVTNDAGSDSNLGLGLADGDKASALLTIDGSDSSVITTPGITIGIEGQGKLAITHGARLESGHLLEAHDALGYLASASGEAQVDGPDSAWISHSALIVGYQGAGRLVISNGGAVSNVFNSYIGLAGSGEVLISGEQSRWTTGNLALGWYDGASATLTLSDGGTLATTGFDGSDYDLRVGVAAGADAVINIGAAAGQTAVAPGRLETPGMQLGDSGQLVFNHSSAAYLFEPQISGSGLIRQLAGTTIINSESRAFGGATEVSGGFLKVDGALGDATATLAVTSGATLGGSGVIGGDVTIAAGGAIAPAATGTAGTLTIDGNLTLAADARLDYDLGDVNVVGGPLNDLIIVHGDLTLAGILNVSASPGGRFDPGIYGLIRYDGALTDLGLTLGEMPPGSAEILQTSIAGQINLIRDDAPPGSANAYTFWDGGSGPHGDGAVSGGNGVWQNGAGNSNWTDQSGAPTGVWADGQFAIFMATPGVVTVDDSLGAVTASGMQFAVDGYRVEGDGITLTSPQTIIRVGDGTTFGATTTATINASLKGEAELIKRDLGTLRLGGVSTLSGATVVDAGTLLVSGALPDSRVAINNGATLSGDGTVGGIAAAAGATVVPGLRGNIGVLHVNGDVSFAAGSIYRVALDPDTASAIAASGAATLSGGTVEVLAGMGNYAPSYTYTILSAAGGRLGSFAGVTSNLAFLTPSLSDDEQHVYLTMSRNDVSFATVGKTPNQRATASGVDALPPGHPVWDAVVQLDPETARQAFDQLSGDIHPSAQGALIEDSRLLRESAFDRLRQAACDNAGSAVARVVNAPGQRRSEIRYDGQCADDQPAVWARVFSATGDTRSDGNAARFNRNISGLFVGIDRQLAGAVRVGMSSGYSHTDFNSPRGAGSGDSYRLAAYLGSQWGSLAIRAGAGRAWHEIRTSRPVAFAGFADNLKSGYRADMRQIFGEIGYPLGGATATLEPFVNLAHVDLDTRRFAERGGSAALTIKGGRNEAIFSAQGLRGTASFDFAGRQLKATAMFGRRHAFGGVTPRADMRFSGGGSRFSIAGVPIAKNLTFIDAGFDLTISRNASLGLLYNGQFGPGVSDNGLRLNFRLLL
ncbi:MAG: autotransporter domain-containing protein [Azonexus sp.]|jgi:outer membrane autotransporter protein|nr:autotransporter domain-containing protein [Azonexus sp.]